MKRSEIHENMIFLFLEFSVPNQVNLTSHYFLFCKKGNLKNVTFLFRSNSCQNLSWSETWDWGGQYPSSGWMRWKVLQDVAGTSPREGILQYYFIDCGSHSLPNLLIASVSDIRRWLIKLIRKIMRSCASLTAFIHK